MYYLLFLFLSHTWVQEKSESFNSLVFLFNQKGKWSIGTKSIFFYHVWNDSHFTAYLCCKRISCVLHVQFCKSHKKWTIGFCLKQEQKKLKREKCIASLFNKQHCFHSLYKELVLFSFPCVFMVPDTRSTIFCLHRDRFSVFLRTNNLLLHQQCVDIEIHYQLYN